MGRHVKKSMSTDRALDELRARVVHKILVLYLISMTCAVFVYIVVMLWVVRNYRTVAATANT